MESFLAVRSKDMKVNGPKSGQSCPHGPFNLYEITSFNALGGPCFLSRKIVQFRLFILDCLKIFDRPIFEPSIFGYLSDPIFIQSMARK